MGALLLVARGAVCWNGRTDFHHFGANERAFAAVNDDSRIACWGQSDQGVSDCPSGTGYASVYASSRAMSAIKTDGSIEAWGLSGYGGTGAPSGTGFEAIYSSDAGFIARKGDGSLACWGQNCEGTPPDSGYDAPVVVALTYYQGKAAIKSGAITCWGHTSYGGTGTT